MADRTKTLDVFKFVVLALMISALGFLLKWWGLPAAFQTSQTIEAGQNPVVGEEPQKKPQELSEFPAFPASGIPLTLDEMNAVLIDDHGVPKFRLDEDGKNWQPFIPDHVLSELPKDFDLVKDESDVWHILDSNGGSLYSLDQAGLVWNPALASIPEGSANEDGVQTDLIECPGANPSRISGVGATLQVVNALIPLRSSPSAEARNIIQPLLIGTRLNVVSLPDCVGYLDGANLWWGVETEKGVRGFAAEASAVSDLYYLAEIK